MAKQSMLIRALFIVSCIAGVASSQEATNGEWLESEAFHRQLETRIGFAWSSEPLRQKLDTLSRHVRVAVWLDRRIDPSQQPELSIPEMPLEQCFEQLASHLAAGVCHVGPVVYLGPKSTAAKLATVSALRNSEAAQLPAEAQKRLTSRKTWQWEILTTPRELLEQLANEGGVKFVGMEKIPHDLWAAGNLPTLTFCERLTLVLAGFDLTFQFGSQGKVVRFVPLPENPRLARDYPVRGDVDRWLSQLRQAVPEAQLKRDGSRIAAFGRAEDHVAIDRILKGEKARAPAAGPARTVYQMKAKNMLGTVLKTLQVQAGLNISFDPAAQSKLRDIVTFEVQGATLEELLTEALKGTGLQFELKGKDLKIFAAEPG